MKLRSLVIFVILMPLLAGCGSSDATWEKALVGTWKHLESGPNGLSVEGLSTYLPDGKMKLGGAIRLQDKERTMRGSGTWRVEKGYLLVTIEESNVADIFPNGSVVKSKIVSVTDKEYTFLADKNGGTKTEVRVP